MNNTLIDNIFHYFSKVIIFIPLVILGVGLLFKYGFFDGTNAKKTINLPTPSPSVQNSIKSVTDGVKLNLNGSLVCGSDEAKLYIKSKKITFINQANKKLGQLVFNGDCLYVWNKNTYSGTQTCGLGQYLPLLDTVTNFGFFGTENFIPVLAKMSGKDLFATGEADLKKITTTCHKEEITDETIFEAPKNIYFKKVPWLRPNFP